MTQKDKNLLLRDLCERLSYGVKVLLDIERQFDGGSICTLTSIKLEETPIFNVDVTLHDCSIEEFRPYLRPMSNMTEEEKKEYNHMYDVYVGYEGMYSTINMFDWFNKHHFDYRGLIEKGLAIKAPEGMYD